MKGPRKKSRQRRAYRGMEALRTYDHRQSELLQFGGLLQSLPKLVVDLQRDVPGSAELRHLEAHGFREWAVVEDWSLYTRLVDETVLCRMVDLFHGYLADIMRLALKHEPRLLRSGVSLKADEVLDYTSIDDVVEHLVSKKVDDWSYRGFHACTAIRPRWNGSESRSRGAGRRGRDAGDCCRNILVHNRGIINQRFLNQTGAKDVAIGTRYEVRTGDVFTWMGAIQRVVDALDAGVASHFKIPRKEIRRRRKRAGRVMPVPMPGDN